MIISPLSLPQDRQANLVWTLAQSIRRPAPLLDNIRSAAAIRQFTQSPYPGIRRMATQLACWPVETKPRGNDGTGGTSGNNGGEAA